MLIVFAILVIISSVILGFIVLIQNPKGGGLSGSLSGISTQLMGVKQTTDVLEKGTWLFSGIVGALCLLSPLFIPKGTATIKNEKLINEAPTTAPKAATPPATPMPGTAAPKSDSPR